MTFSLQPSTGIYVGTKDVYIAQVQRLLLGARLIKFGKTEIRGPAPQKQGSGVSRERGQAIVEAVRRAIQESKINTKNVSIALAGKDVLIRYFQMPKIPKQEWDVAIKFEAKKYIPFKIEDLMWDYHVVAPKGKDSKMDITFAAVKAETAQWYIALMEQAGLEVTAIEPSPFSLVRIFSLSGQLEKGKAAAIIDVEHDMADINVVKDKICYLTRDVSIPLEEEMVFESIINEIRMSLDYYEKLFPAEVINKILLCGDVERKEWDRFIMEELRIPVDKINLKKAIKVGKVVPPYTMGVAIGLGLREFTRSVPTVNLCREHKAVVVKELAAKTEGLKLTPDIQRSLIQAVIVSCICLGGLYAWFYTQIDDKKKELQEVISLRPAVTLKSDINTVRSADLENEKIKLRKEVNALSDIINKRMFWTEKLNEIPKMLPPGLWLTDLEISEDLLKGRSMTIRGVANHNDPVQEIAIITKFISNLKQNETFLRGFDEIALGGMEAAEINGMSSKTFIITCVRR